MNFFEIEKQKFDVLKGLLKGDKNDKYNWRRPVVW
jgi:hypothetical protein